MENMDKTQEIIKLFQKINPVIEENSSYKKAIDFLISKNIPFKQIKKIVDYAISIQGEKYAPVITNPIQLKNKLCQLIIFAKKQQNNRPITI